MVSFEGNGVIRAGSTQGRTTVTIFSDADGQAVSVAVEIRDIAQLTLVGDTTMYVGEEKTLAVLLMDELGRPFDLDTSSLAVSSLFNNMSIFSITSTASPSESKTKVAASQGGYQQNITFTVAANCEGETIIKFWQDETFPSQISVDLVTAQQLAALKSAQVPKVHPKGSAEIYEANTRIADFLTLRAIHRIMPQGDEALSSKSSRYAGLLLHVGAACNFTSESSEHFWWSDNEDILKIDSISGKAKAGRRTGTTYVNHRGLLTNRARVLVTQVEKLKLESGKGSSIDEPSIIVPGKEFQFPITAYGSDGSELVDIVENSSLMQNIYITCHLDEQAMLDAIGREDIMQRRWGSVKTFGKRDPGTGKHYCVVNVTEFQDGEQEEFPFINALAFSARASDKARTYSYVESFENRIPYVPNLRVRVMYPHEIADKSPVDSSRKNIAGGFPAPGGGGGRPLVGCVELQASRSEAYIDVFRREFSSMRKTNDEDKGPKVDRHDDVSVVLVQSERQQGGWVRYRYLVSARMNSRSGHGPLPFEQRVVTFSDPTIGLRKDICVSYGQYHQHRWYCAITDEISPMPTVFRRSACGQCPPQPVDVSSDNIDTRYREIRCCSPDAGIECVAPDEVSSTYRCNAADRPDKDCSVFNRAANGFNNHASRRRNYEDMSDDEIVENSMPMLILLALLGLGAASYLFGDNFLETVKDVLRAFFCPSNHRDPRRVYARAIKPGAPTPALGRRAADFQQDYARGHREVFNRRHASPVVGAGSRGVQTRDEGVESFIDSY